MLPKSWSSIATMDSPTKHHTDALRLGAVVLRLADGGELEIEHTSKSGHIVVVTIDRVQLERWALRQLRAEAFA